MESGLLIALGSGLLSFLVFLMLFRVINKNLNIELPGWLTLIITLLLIGGLYYKRDFFFDTPIVTGVTIGILLSLAWNIRETEFVFYILSTVFSPRFIIWAAATFLGIYKRNMVLSLWDKYITFNTIYLELIVLVFVFIVYIIGTMLVLFPESRTKKMSRSEGFSMINRVPTSKKILTQFWGIILVLLTSGLIIKAYIAVYNIIFNA